MRRRFRIFADAIFPVLLLLLFLFTPFREIRFIAFFFLVVRGLGFLYTRLVPRLIEVARESTVTYCQRFQTFTVRIEVTNRGLFPVHYLTVADTLGSLVSDEPASFVLGLAPGAKTTLTYEASGHHRGDYTVGPVALRGSDAFGFFQWERQVEQTMRVVVYPSVFPLMMSQKTGLPSGNILVNNRLYEDVTRFRSVREYMEGDELKRINWKVSARLGKLYSMEYTPSIYFPVVILLNLTDRDFPVAQKQNLVERAIEMAASLIFFFVGIKQEVGLITTGSIRGQEGFPVAPVRAGYGHAVSMLEILSRVQTAETPVNFAQFLFRSGVSIPTGSKIMVVSPPLKQEQADTLLSTKRKGYDLEVFLSTSHTMKQEDIMVHGIRSHTIREYGKELVRG